MIADVGLSVLLGVVLYGEGEEVGPAKMTAVQQPPLTGDAGLHWDANNIVDSDLDEFEDDESNSAKLFERSRIRALAGVSQHYDFLSCLTSFMTVVSGRTNVRYTAMEEVFLCGIIIFSGFQSEKCSSLQDFLFVIKFRYHVTNRIDLLRQSGLGLSISHV